MKKSETMIPVTRPLMPPQESFLEYAQSLWDTRWLTHGGPLVQKLQSQLEQKLKVPYLTAFCNGHLALDCALKALNLRDGEAITTPYTYISTTNALVMNGLKPVFCDIKPTDCTMDETKLEALITEKTRVIVPVHVYGFPCNDAAIEAVAARHGLKVVYDSAHAFGVEVDGQGIGTLGDAAMFSFHATKVYHTVEGGAIACRDAKLAERLIVTKNFGLTGAEEADSIGLNAKMTEMHAAVGLANLALIDRQIETRKGLVEHYLDRLSAIPGIELFHWDCPGVKYNYAYFPICIAPDAPVCRDEIASRLMEDYNAQVRKYFYPLTSEFACYQEQSRGMETPVAKDFSRRVITLPLYVELTHPQVDYICDALREILSPKR